MVRKQTSKSNLTDADCCQVREGEVGGNLADGAWHTVGRSSFCIGLEIMNWK